MGEIILHAATPETGSRRVQHWIRERSHTLIAHGIVPLRVRRRGTGDAVGLEIAPAASGPADSAPIWHLAAPLRADGDDDRLGLLAGNLAEALDRAVARHERVLLAGDGVNAFVTRVEPHLLRAIEQLAATHTVRLLYAAGPQHHILEDAWCSYGFRSGRPPSEWIPEAAPVRNHLAVLVRTTMLTPSVEMEVIGYRADLLHGGTPETDLAVRLLDEEAAPADPRGDRLRGDLALPLAVACALRDVTDDVLFPPDESTAPRLLRLRRCLTDGAPEPPMTAAMRDGIDLLHRWCHEQFAETNESLAGPAGWSIPLIEPPATTATEPVDLGLLDDLWVTDGTDDERARLVQAWRTTSRVERPLTADVAAAAGLVDLGCGRGDTVASAPDRFGVTGIGIEQREARVHEAQAMGRAVYRGDILDLDPDDFPAARYVSIDNVLEHLPDLDAVRAALDVAIAIASDLVFIRHPSFDEIDHLADLGCKLYWTDWPDEHVMPLRLAELLDLVIQAGVSRFEVRPVLRITDSDDLCVLPLDAPPDQTRLHPEAPGVYDRRLHGPKPSVPFDRPVWYAFDLFLVVGDGDPVIEYPSDPATGTARPRVRWRAPGTIAPG